MKRRQSMRETLPLIGLTIGFAVLDSLGNYISSAMLSLLQPFRANGFVRIDEHEGIVVRLTSRATILITADGLHLRIPNADVLKACILNDTRNPQQRFEFTLGVDANHDSACRNQSIAFDSTQTPRYLRVR